MKVASTTLLSLSLLLSVTTLSAQVKLGQSAALSGPTEELGKEMKKGAEAYFSSVSGVQLISMDDKYEPKICTDNTNKFIKDNVAALFGYVGTPTAKVAVPIAMSAKKVFFGPFTGADFVSDVATNPYSFSVRASYCMETDKMVDALVAKGIKKIGIFVQDDGFGDVGKTCAAQSLKKHGLTIAEEGRYKRNTIAVKEGADKIFNSGVGGVILVGAYRPCGAAIKYWKKKGFNVPFINISFVGSKALAKEVASDSSNVYVTQVVPNPWDSSIAIVKEYKEKIKGEPGFISLEGYITAKILHKAILAAGADAVNSDKLKSAIEALGTFDIGGLKVSFGSQDHRGLDAIYLTEIGAGGKFSYIDGLK